VIVKALNFAAEGKVKAIIETQPLESINDVFERLKAGKVNGRVVLTIGVQAPWVGRPHHPHEGGRSRRGDRQVRRSLLLYLDTPRARRDRALLRHSRGTRIVGAFATADRRAAQTRCECMRGCPLRCDYRDLPGFNSTLWG